MLIMVMKGKGENVNILVEIWKLLCAPLRFVNRFTTPLLSIGANLRAFRSYLPVYRASFTHNYHNRKKVADIYAGRQSN